MENIFNKYYLQFVKFIRESSDIFEIFFWHITGGFISGLLLGLESGNIDVIRVTFVASLISGSYNVLSYLKTKIDYKKNKLDNK